MWLAFQLTQSSLFVGVAGFLTRAPTAIQFLFGPLVDRWDIRRIFVGTQFVQGLFVLIIPIAAVLDALSIWILLGVIPILSLTNQLAMPAYQAVLPRVVASENLTEANSLFATAAQGINAVFNGLSGLLIAVVGATALFTIDAITFFIAMILLSQLSLSAADSGESKTEPASAYLSEIKEGFDYLRGSLVLQIAAIATFTNFGYGAVLAALPEYANSIGGPEAYGVLTATLAAGSFVGALGASFISDVRYGRFLFAGYLTTAIGVILAVVLPGIALTAAAILVASVALGAYSVLTRSMMQSVVDNSLLGRVMSITQSAYDVMVPVGSLVGGFVSAQFAPRVTFYALGGIYVVNVLYIAGHGTLRSLPKVSEMDKEMLRLSAEN
jgi:MFS family permease